MDPFDDDKSDQPTRAELVRQVHQLEQKNRRLEALLEETFEAWLDDKRRCARIEEQLLPKSFEELLATTSTEPSISQIIAEMENKFDGPASPGS
jgi:hypothetical protein